MIDLFKFPEGIGDYYALVATGVFTIAVIRHLLFLLGGKR